MRRAIGLSVAAHRTIIDIMKNDCVNLWPGGRVGITPCGQDASRLSLIHGRCSRERFKRKLWHLMDIEVNRSMGEITHSAIQITLRSRNLLQNQRCMWE